MPILRQIKDFLVGSPDIDVYGGNKGGYGYLVFYDKKSKEVNTSSVFI
jgi:hypothetical protein